MLALPLFNGRDLTGWVHEGPRATFSAESDELRTSGKGNQPNWLHTAREYENFLLTFDYKLAKWAEAQVILRAPKWGRPAQSGLAIELAHDFHKGVVDNYVTGAVAGARPPQNPLPGSFDEWHSVRIALDGNRLRVTIDGKLQQDLDLEADPELRHRLKRGYIGFPDLGHAYALRNLEIEDHGSPTKFTFLRDIRNWQLRDAGSWSMQGDSIVGANGHGILYAPPVFEDFELTMLVRSHNRVNSGVFLRGEPTGRKRGFEVQIYSPPDAVYPTGSIYAIQRSRVATDYEERWFLLQIRVQGRRCTVRLDGETVAETDKIPAEYTRGQIGLQIHMEDSSAEFQDIRVRPV